MNKRISRKKACGLGLAMTSALLVGPGYAADIAFNAYFELPLNGGNPYFGLRAFPVEDLLTSSTSGYGAQAPQGELELRYDGVQRWSFLVNGFRLAQPRVLNESDGSGEQQQESDFDWRLIPAAALGVGLVAVIVKSGDASVSACSGKDCSSK